MDIYYLMIESMPLPENEESQEVSGGFINCWVRADNPDFALQAAEAYAANEGWKLIRIEEIKIVNNEDYQDPDAKECYEEAKKNGFGAIIYAWEIDPAHDKSRLS